MRLHGLLFCALFAVTACKNDDQDQDGYSAEEDCDDFDADVFPGADELCNGEDDDCDGAVDDAPVNGDAWYFDGDGDDFGDPATETTACEEQVGLVRVAGDCDDADEAVNPGAAEICNDVDDNCDGASDIDAIDGTTFYADGDGDGYGADDAPLVTCAMPEGYVIDAGDCEDALPEVHPGAAEVCADGLDNNCDGSPNQCAWSGDISAADADAILAGELAGGLLGGELAWAGDLDGDGFDDALLGAHGAPLSGVETYEGRMHIAYGGAAELGADVTLSGDEPSGYVGYASAGLGDLDGDGFDDAVIGAPGHDGFGGAAWLLYGGAARPADAVIADALVGYLGAAGEAAGSGAASAGDVDADGRPDLLVGGFFADGLVDGAGSAWLIYGSETRPSGQVPLSAAAALRIDGVSPGSDLGDRNAMAGGDFDGDGASDLVFGVWSRDTLPYEANTWVFYGDAAAPLGGTVAVSDGDAQIASLAYGSGYMSALAAGDVDGDGLEDLALTIDMQQASEESNAYLFYGSTTRLPEKVQVTTADVTVLGDHNEFTLVPTAGDVDGDGLNDLALGSEYNEHVSVDAGAVSVFFGGALSGVYGNGAPHARFLGAEEFGGFGYSVAADGDMNGDGVDDLLVGALYAGAAQHGAAYLFLGKAW